MTSKNINDSSRVLDVPVYKLSFYPQQYLSKITDSVPDIIHIYDLKKKKTTFVNKSFTSILGYKQEDMLSGKINWYDIIHPIDQKDAPNVLSKILTLKDDETIEYDVRSLKNDGTYIWLHNKLNIFLRSRDGSPRCVLLISHDITYKKNIEDQLTVKTRTDHLTGIANRSLFIEILEKRIKSNQMNFAVLFLDLNKFKVVNDTHGHAIGDKVIIEAANRLSKIFNQNHLVARLGGDEFTVIIDQCIDTKELKEYQKKIKKAFIEVIRLNDVQLKLDISVGSILANTLSKPTSTQILHLADKSMYLDKKKFYKGVKIPKRR
jgi:diguanylate cyclase (GGDEF)-like protein/PAS domain S-box-containing protein